MELAQTLALTIAGVLAVPLLQVVKRYIKTQDVPFAWIAYITSFLVAIIAVLLSGKMSWSQLSDPMTLFGSGSIVFGVSQVVYRTLKEKLK